MECKCIITIGFSDETNQIPNYLTKSDFRNISYIYKSKIESLPKDLPSCSMTKIRYQASSLELCCKADLQPTQTKLTPTTSIFGEKNPYMNVIVDYNGKQYKSFAFDACWSIDIDIDSEEDDVQIIDPPPGNNM